MLTEKDYNRLFGKVEKKFKNKTITTADGKFDSNLEYCRWCELLTLEKIGQIKGLERQKKFVLIDKSIHGKEITYIADFVYFDGDKYVVEDAKSSTTKTPLYRLKKRLLAERYGIKIKEITREQI
jgi:recombinational DNA repair protein RecR